MIIISEEYIFLGKWAKNGKKLGNPTSLCHDMMNSHVATWQKGSILAGYGSMSRHECPCCDMGTVTKNVLLNSSKLASFACRLVLICKTKAKRGISVELNEYGVNLALKDLYIREIHT